MSKMQALVELHVNRVLINGGNFVGQYFLAGYSHQLPGARRN